MHRLSTSDGQALSFTEPAHLSDEVSGRLHLCVTWKCNYSCSYCFQNSSRDGRPIFEDTKPWPQAFARLPGTWMVMITGGEPLLYANLAQLGALIARAGHQVTLVTNLSASARRLLEFAGETGRALRMISASWHPEHVTLDQFAEKFAEVRSGLTPETQLVASLTVTPATRAFLPEVRALAERGQIPFLIRDYREFAGSTIQVVRPSGEAGVTAGSTWLSHRRTKGWQGATCSAGLDYFVVDSDGLAYRCLSDLDAGAPPVGDFLKDFAPWTHAAVCSHSGECCLNENHKKFPTRSWPELP